MAKQPWRYSCNRMTRPAVCERAMRNGRPNVPSWITRCCVMIGSSSQGKKSGRGFYVKAVAKRDVLAFMYFECDENHYPVSKETLTAMSKSFNGN